MNTSGHPDQASSLLSESAWLRQLARSLVDDASAEDAIQETYLAALTSPPRTEQPLRPWLARVLRNFVRMGVRQQTRRWARDRVAGEAAAEQPLPTAEDLLAHHQALRSVADAVAALEEPYRSTVLLCYSEGLPPSEIARRQAILPGTVRWRLKRGLDKVRAHLDRAHQDRPDPRAAWVAAAVPLARRTPSAPPLPGPKAAPFGDMTHPAIIGGAGLMKTKMVMAALGVGLLLLLGWWLASQGQMAAGPGKGVAGGDETTARGLSHAGSDDVGVGAGPRGFPQLTQSPGPSAEGDQPRTGPSGSIEGRVRDPRGRPVAGARVAAVTKVSASDVGAGRRQLGVAATARTDSSGHYRISKLPLDTYAITVSARGFEPGHRGEIRLVHQAPRASGVDLALEAGGAVLRGTVSDVGGGAIAGARVLAIAPESQAPVFTHTYQAITQADGTYELDLRRRGRYVMAAAADGYAQVRLWGVVMDGDQRKDIVLEPNAQVSGRVRDGIAQRPVANAIVRLARERSRFPLGFTATTQADGTWRIRDVAPGSYRVWARAGGRVGRLERSLEVGATDAVEGVTLDLQPGRSIIGRVRSPEGQPVPAEVWFEKEEGTYSQDKQAVAGPDGRFRIEGVLPATYSLLARHPGFREGSQTVVIGKEDVAGVELVLRTEARIHGRVLTADGRPVDQVRVAARAELGGGNRRLITTRTRREGEFVMDNLGPCDIDILAEDAHLGVARASVRLGEGDQETVTLRLGPGVVLSGRAQEGGQPAAGAFVTVLQGKPGLQIQRTVRTDEHGHFLVTGLAPGEAQALATFKEPPAELTEIPPIPLRVTVVLAQDEQAPPIALTIAR